MTDYQAAIYPANTEKNPTVTQADTARKDVAVCFSGGGSRALTCAWGQMIGLNTLKSVNGQPLLEQVRYISSVSGGSWASVLYAFRPQLFNDADFLGKAFAPGQLFYNQTRPGGMNVSVMPPSALGKIPQNFANLFDIDPLRNIIADFLAITALKGISLAESAPWLWMFIVGKNVLADFGLYTYHNSLFKPHEKPWDYSGAKFFSLSEDYAEQAIFSKSEAPPKDAFVFARTGADGRPSVPMLIVNTNVIGKDCPNVRMSQPMQIPTQVSPVSGGIYGGNPCTPDNIGGGTTESFSFTSMLQSLPASNTINADFPRRYTLADITSCSSAFYAAVLADPLQSVLATLLDFDDDHLSGHFARFVAGTEQLLIGEMRSRLKDMAEEAKGLSKASLVPRYNYWPVNEVSKGVSANQTTQFTDGGDLENTGVAGLLAQVQNAVGNIIVFVNGAEVLEQAGNEIIAATQMAPLFGMTYDSTQKRFKNYLTNGVNPFTGLTDPEGFLQVFDNSQGEFDALRNSLWIANGSGAKSNPAFYKQTLTIVKNTLLGINQSRSVNVLWAQNAVVNRWQQQIADPTLQQKLNIGQQNGSETEFAHFPYYSTFLKIHQTAAETNTLAQMWAWCVGNSDSPLSSAIAELFASAD